MNRSYWDNTLLPKRFDFIVIGSGIVGLSAAIHLKERYPQKQIAVVERGATPIGASTKNAGFACFGSLSEIVDDLHTMNENEVLALIVKRWNGLQYLRKITRGYNIGYENNGGYEVFTPELEPLFEECMGNINRVNRMLLPTFGESVFRDSNEQIKQFGLGNTKFLLFNPFEGQLHTGLLMKTLVNRCRKSDIHLLYGVDVTDWHESTEHILLHSESMGDLKTEKLIFATNGFAKELLPKLDVIPARAQVLVTSPIDNLKLKGTFHMDRGYYYFRNIDNRVLLGGARNVDKENESTNDQRTTAIIQNALDDTLKNVVLPELNCEIEMRWAGTMGVGDSKAPIVQRITPRAAVAVRMGGMGIAIGSEIGKEVAELISD